VRFPGLFRVGSAASRGELESRRLPLSQLIYPVFRLRKAVVLLGFASYQTD